MPIRPLIQVQLIHIHGGLKGEIQEFNDSAITVGRLSSCTVRFPADEPGVSREHAVIERVGNQFILRDLSKFGTCVNSKQVNEAYLRSGDVLEFGPGGPKVSINLEVLDALPAAQDGPALSVAPGPVHAAVSQPSRPVPPAPIAAASAVPWDGNPPVSGSAAPTAFQKTVVPLIIQVGPMIRTFRELPVTLGANPPADFVIRGPGIEPQHAQFYFSQNRYWIRDLTGRGAVRVNKVRVESEVPLSPDDEIECAPKGPRFRFLGEGRLAEIEPLAEAMVEPGVTASKVVPEVAKKNNDSFISKILKGLKP